MFSSSAVQAGELPLEELLALYGYTVSDPEKETCLMTARMPDVTRKKVCHQPAASLGRSFLHFCVLSVIGMEQIFCKKKIHGVLFRILGQIPFFCLEWDQVRINLKGGNNQFVH